MSMWPELDAYLNGYLETRLQPYGVSLRILALCKEPENRQLVFLCVETNPALLAHTLGVTENYEKLVGALGNILGWSKELQEWLWERMGWVFRHDMGKLLNGEENNAKVRFIDKPKDVRRRHIAHPLMSGLLAQSLLGAGPVESMKIMGHHPGLLEFMFAGKDQRSLYGEWEVWLYDGLGGLEEILFTVADVGTAMAVPRPHSNVRSPDDLIVRTLENHLDFDTLSRVFQLTGMSDFFGLRETIIQQEMVILAKIQKRFSREMGLGEVAFQTEAISKLGKMYLQQLQMNFGIRHYDAMMRVMERFPDWVL